MTTHTEHDLRDAIDQISELHTPVTEQPDPGVGFDGLTYCDHCGRNWPCPTAQAVKGCYTAVSR